MYCLMSSTEIKKLLADHGARLRALERLQTRENNALKPDLSPAEIANLSPRTQAERITAGIDKPRFIGIMSLEVIEQLIWSIKNTKPAFLKKELKKSLPKLEAEYKKRSKTRKIR